MSPDYQRVRAIHQRIVDENAFQRAMKTSNDIDSGLAVIRQGVHDLTGYWIDTSCYWLSTHPTEAQSLTRKIVNTYRLLSETNGAWEHRRAEIVAELNRLSVCAYIECSLDELDEIDCWSDAEEDAYNDAADAAEDRMFA